MDLFPLGFQKIVSEALLFRYCTSRTPCRTTTRAKASPRIDCLQSTWPKSPWPIPRSAIFCQDRCCNTTFGPEGYDQCFDDYWTFQRSLPDVRFASIVKPKLFRWCVPERYHVILTPRCHVTAPRGCCVHSLTFLPLEDAACGTGPTKRSWLFVGKFLLVRWTLWNCSRISIGRDSVGAGWQLRPLDPNSQVAKSADKCHLGGPQPRGAVRIPLGWKIQWDRLHAMAQVFSRVPGFLPKLVWIEIVRGLSQEFLNKRTFSRCTSVRFGDSESWSPLSCSSARKS